MSWIHDKHLFNVQIDRQSANAKSFNIFFTHWILFTFLSYSNIFQNGKLILTKEDKLIEKHLVFFLKIIHYTESSSADVSKKLRAT